MRSQTIVSALGLILLGLGVIILTPIAVAVLEEEYGSIPPFLFASATALFAGLICQWRGGWGRNFDNVSKSEGLLIVVLVWMVMSVVSAIPYLFYGLGPVDALFEAVSGVTTTGATILTDFSLYPKDFFFWRSLTQWLGGMGIIVLFAAILPQFAVAGRRMFHAEAPGPTEEKFTPRLTHTAKALWLIYILLTVLETGALWGAGMPLYDAVCNSLSTMAAGGFSPHPQSIMGYDRPLITWIVTLFMVLAGSNFALQFRAMVKLQPRRLLASEEIRLYLAIIAGCGVILALILFLGGAHGPGASARDAVFQIVSILTTTGFASTDFALWLVPAQALLILVMCIGGCAGSAGGGVKVVRVLFLMKYLVREISQILHPRAVLQVKLDGITVPSEVQRQILGFLLFYVLLTLFSSLAVTMIEGNMAVGFIGTLATIGNIGPGLGEIGPMGTFGMLALSTKLLFIFDMLVGRLELVPMLAMLHPDFWRR